MDALRYYGNFVPDVRGLCDQMYKHHGPSASRRIAYHDQAISLIENLMSLSQAEGAKTGSLDETDEFDQFFDQLVSGSKPQGQFSSETDPLTMGSDDLVMHLCGIPDSDAQPGNLQVPRVTTTPPDNLISVPPANPSETPPEAEQSAQDQQPQQQAEPGALKPTEADSCCDLCGYRPKGQPQWFKGSMAKHRKLKHSTEPPKIYKCPFPGCASQYKNRPDNLRQHQIEKGHFVGGEAGGAPRRPSKRKKTAVEDRASRERS